MSATTTITYRIEARLDGRWQPAPGEATGWTLDEARRAVAAGLVGLDGSALDPDDVRIVDEATGAVVPSSARYTVHPIASPECDALTERTLIGAADTYAAAQRIAEEASGWPYGAGIRETASGRIDVGFGLGVEAPDAEA